jgi:hypothetical protein
MRRSIMGVLLLAIVCGNAAAQSPFPDYAYLIGHYDGVALQLEIKIGELVTNPDFGTSVGFDLYRTTLATTACAQEVRLTDQPILWPGGPFPATAALTDAAVTPNTAYRYRIAPVDAQRNPANLIGTGGEATTGVALLTHGRIFNALWLGYWCYLCPQECIGDGQLRLPSELLPYADTDVSLLLYGEIVGVTFDSNAYWPIYQIDHGVPSGCVLAVQPSTWSLVKYSYR